MGFITDTSSSDKIGTHVDFDSDNSFEASATNPRAAAIEGSNTGSGAIGVLAGAEPFGQSPVGVFGRSSSTGVFGFGKDVGVAGNTDSGSGTGVHGHTSRGAGVLGTCDGPGFAGKFVGRVRVEGNTEVTGILFVEGDVLLKNQDLSERFEVSADGEPGSVMVIGDNAQLALCEREYDKRAVGVISGAGTRKPAITLGVSEEAPGRTQPIAMVGTAFCLVDADAAPIEAGDLLTTSDTRGHAMKATDPLRSFGAIIGKALAPLPSGRGLIPIVVTLQ